MRATNRPRLYTYVEKDGRPLPLSRRLRLPRWQHEARRRRFAQVEEREWRERDVLRIHDCTVLNSREATP